MNMNLNLKSLTANAMPVTVIYQSLIFSKVLASSPLMFYFIWPKAKLQDYTSLITEQEHSVCLHSFLWSPVVYNSIFNTHIHQCTQTHADGRADHCNVHTHVAQQGQPGIWQQEHFTWHSPPFLETLLHNHTGDSARERGQRTVILQKPWLPCAFNWQLLEYWWKK